jgi:hypothetical protein
MKTTINAIQLLKYPAGNLAFIQEDVLPFEFKRVYYLLMYQVMHTGAAAFTLHSKKR